MTVRAALNCRPRLCLALAGVAAREFRDLAYLSSRSDRWAVIGCRRIL
jgi:hypothetical protein